jgi:predicted small lipoprotein YifL
MRKAILLPVIAFAAFGLAGCGKKAPNEALEANESIAGDSNAMGEAVSDEDAANAAFSNQEAAYDAVPAVNTTGGSNVPEEGSGDE